MNDIIKNLQSNEFAQLVGADGIYIIKKSFADLYKLEQGEHYQNFKTSFSFIGTADEVVAKCHELKLKYKTTKTRL